ncbi:hypothetical protein BK796_03170 [Kosakonia pseudosacchari]|uniref:Uncharacterized protein n=1 Tax=Kosakonia pseudosacchari TaxID=1646340 RepID=A0ABX4IUV6_9ENTR|nr:hypothetical protein BK796_03170 [Kosakonia pseudosacchari]
MYTPESILFPYCAPIFAQIRAKNKQHSTPEEEQDAPGAELYGANSKAQGSSRIFIRSFKQ